MNQRPESPDSTNQGPEAMPDALIAQYHQANEHISDALSPAARLALRERIMHAAAQASQDATKNIAETPINLPAIPLKAPSNALQAASAANPPQKDAANDSWWNIRAVASVLVLGLSALLFWQFEQASPEDQEATQSATPSRSNAPRRTSESAQSYESPVAAAAPAPAPAAITADNSTAARVESKKAQAKDIASPKATTALPASQAPASEERLTPAPAPAPSVAAAAPAPTLAEPAPAVAATEKRAGKALAETADTASTANASRSREQSFAKPAAPALRASPSESTTARLFTAVQDKNAPALRLALSQADAAPNTRSAQGQTPLHVAVQLRWLEGVKILLAAGADPDLKNSQGLSPRDIIWDAGSNSDEDIKKLLQR